jgi:RAB6A-GEF complex partner protein 1
LVRLLSRAKDEGDWELCKELARFLMALDETGATLMEALEMVDLRSPEEERENSSFMFEGSRLKVPNQTKNNALGINGIDISDRDDRSSSGSRSPISPGSIDPADYFSSGPRE